MPRTHDAAPARLPPRWFVKAAWAVHRRLAAASRGRIGLWNARENRAGVLRLKTVGRRSGAERTAVLGYIEDGPNLVLVAMNGWAAPEPAWWLNLQANPDATVELRNGSRQMRARVASGEERALLWARLASQTKGLDRYAALRPRETALVILEPRSAT